jgi:hypothetical protein
MTTLIDILNTKKKKRTIEELDMELAELQIKLLRESEPPDPKERFLKDINNKRRIYYHKKYFSKRARKEVESKTLGT